MIPIKTKINLSARLSGSIESHSNSSKYLFNIYIWAKQQLLVEVESQRAYVHNSITAYEVAANKKDNLRVCTNRMSHKSSV